MFLRFKDVSMNTENVGYIESKNDKFFLNYKKKASIQKVELEVTEEVRAKAITFFAGYNFFNLEGYFINPDNITFIHEELVREESERFIKITMYFKDSMNLELKVATNRWKVWKANRLKNGY